MNHVKLSPRNIEYLVGILATFLLATGLFLYVVQEPNRIELAQNEQISIDLDEAMNLYAYNCSVCHGLAGEGIGSTPALNDADLRQSDYETLSKVIARGLYGTAMPAWSQADGGPLGNYQIDELVTLIQFGDWNETQDRVVNLGLAPLVPFTTEPDSEVLSQLITFEGGDQLVLGINLYAQECVACHGADGLGTSLAPALNDAQVREKTDEELSRIIRNGIAGTLMAPWDSRLDGESIDALVALLDSWQQVPLGAIPAPERAIAVTEESLALGSDLYASSCARCHGAEGQGTQRAPSLNVKGYLAEVTDAALEQIITLGVPGTSMPAWGDRMTEVDIQAVVGFIRAWEPTAPEVAEPARGGGGPWWSTDGGGTSSGSSGKGGPPWMRNNNAAMLESSALPGGGGVGKTQNQNSTIDHSSASGNLISGNQPVDQPLQDFHPQGNSTNDQHQSGQGGGPPWVQEQTASIWWQSLDWRSLALIAGLLSLTSILIASAWVGLYKLNRTA